jgi:hypothetical protein
MGFDLTSLANYAEENGEKLLTGLVFKSRTIDLVLREGTVQTGIKTSEKISILKKSTVLQNGDGCGFTPQGGVDFSQREIKVSPIKINEEYCLLDLEKKSTQLMMQMGSMPEEMPPTIEEAFIEQTNSDVEEKIERMLWQGDTASVNPDLNKIDGWIKILDAAGVNGSNATRRTGTITATTGSPTVTGAGTSFSAQVAVGDKIYGNGVLLGTVSAVGSNTSLTLDANAAAAVTATRYSTVSPSQASYGTTITGPLTMANVSAAVDSLYLSIPQRVLDSTDPVYLFMGTDVARLWLMALKNANQYNFTVSENDLRDGFSLPGFPIRIKPTPGLSGTSRMFVLQPKNMWVGTDMENEWEEYKWWYSNDADMLRFKSRFKLGVQIGFPDEVTQFQAV